MSQSEINVLILNQFINREEPKPSQYGFENDKNTFYSMIENLENVG